jgi:hypothetical protein
VRPAFGFPCALNVIWAREEGRADAGADIFEALLDAILDDLHRLRGGLPCGRRALLGSLDRDLEHFPCEFGLQCDVLVNLAERLVLLRKRRCLV